MTRPLPNPTESSGAVYDRSPKIRWPERFLPERNPVFVSNEIVIAAPAAVVWAWLLRAERWPEWYSNSAEMHFLSHTGPDLRNRSRFRWRTFGMKVTSKVLEFEPEHRIAWDGQGIGLEAWHAWVLTPLDPTHTHVLTEEVQHGWRARLNKALMPRRMYEKHQEWLEGLGRQAVSGWPA